MLAGCDDDKGPYVAIEGGGFIFNYRIAEAFYGVSLRPERRLEAGTILEVRFDNPAGGDPIVLRETVKGSQLSYLFRTPALQGVRKDHPYRVVVRVLAAGDGKVLDTVERSYKSSVDQSILPSAPVQ